MVHEFVWFDHPDDPGILICSFRSPLPSLSTPSHNIYLGLNGVMPDVIQMLLFFQNSLGAILNFRTQERWQGIFVSICDHSVSIYKYVEDPSDD